MTFYLVKNEWEKNASWFASTNEASPTKSGDDQSHKFNLNFELLRKIQPFLHVLEGGGVSVC